MRLTPRGRTRSSNENSRHQSLKNDLFMFSWRAAMWTMTDLPQSQGRGKYGSMMLLYCSKTSKAVYRLLKKRKKAVFSKSQGASSVWAGCYRYCWEYKTQSWMCGFSVTPTRLMVAAKDLKLLYSICFKLYNSGSNDCVRVKCAAGSDEDEGNFHTFGLFVLVSQSANLLVANPKDKFKFRVIFDIFSASVPGV